MAGGRRRRAHGGAHGPYAVAMRTVIAAMIGAVVIVALVAYGLWWLLANLT